VSGALTEAAVFRRSLAERIAPAYARIPTVGAVFLGGSAAKGHSDRFSDLEIGVIWSAPPTEGDRRSAIEAADGDLVQLYRVEEMELGPFWSDAWKIGRRGGSPFSGVEVDMVHCLDETVERTLRAVVDEFDPDPSKQLLVGGVLHGIALYGDDRLEPWRERASRYSDGLRLAVVRAHVQIEGLWRLDGFAARDNPVAGSRVLVEAQERLLHVLLGLNRAYYSGFKSLSAVVAELPIAPGDLFDRLLASYPLAVGTSKRALTALVEDTFDLVEQQLPEIDVERLRTILAYDRPLWDEGPA
jgi:hypothetical protein